ncbi:MAG: hypothetical protein GXO22_01295 [Aquificae bacterium]|nr:hypothetical protein [Aquificota bacterium]
MIKRIAFLFILALFSYTVKAEMVDYCATPPFLSTDSIKPNILLLIDVSGSMDWSAYNPDSNKEGWCENSSGCGWTYTGTEEGYFVPDKVYTLIGGCNSSNYSSCLWQETTSTSVDPCPKSWRGVYDNPGNYKGSCLNFLLMSRIDLLRWAITGGRPQGCSSVSDPNCDPDISCTGSTCVLETSMNEKVEVPKERINGILQILESQRVKPRFGALFFSGGYILRPEKIYIGDYLHDGSVDNDADATRPYTFLKRIVNYTVPNDRTPSAASMWEAYDYFKQSDEHNINNDFELSTSSTLYRDPIYVCDANRSNCEKVPCAKNYVILASDGQWNTNVYGGASCSIEDGYEFNSSDPVVPAYLMHSQALRTETSLSGLSFDIKVDRLYALGMFLGGTGEQSLKNVSVYGSFDSSVFTWPYGTDTDGTLWNGSGAQYPWKDCYMDDCGFGRGSGCTPLPPSYPDWDADGNGEPDTFFGAQNATEIKNALLKFIGDILKRVSSGTSVSVLAERRKEGATVSQATFYPEKKFGTVSLTWIGHLYQYWFLNTQKAQNIREDTNNNWSLDITGDYILDFNIDLDGKLYIDAYESDIDGNPTTVATTYNSLDEVNYLWDAGEELAKTRAVDRNIYGISETGAMKSFDIGNKLEFDSLLGNSSTQFPSCLLDIDGNPDYDKLISYIRGEDIAGCRSRTLADGNVWKLADIVYSTPIVVNYGDFSVTFIGANDGMLHAFLSGYIEKQTGTTVAVLCDKANGVCGTGENLGKEIWAFIPKNVMPYLRYLADPDYCHLYMIDLTPYTIDLDTDGNGETDKKVIIGGFRLGGGCGCSSGEADCIKPPIDTCSDPTSPTCVGLSSYFALDITDPYNPVFLWEFSSKDLGFSYSGPAYIKRKEGTLWKHFVMFASGPTSYEGLSSKPLSVFVLDLLTGTLVRQYTFSSLNNSFGGRLFTDGLDVDIDGQTDYVFLGYTKTDSTVSGGVVKIWTGDINPANWDFDTSFFSLVNNPVTAKVESMSCFGKNYVYVGTGKYFYKRDDESSINSLFGIPFICDANNNCEVTSISSATSVNSSPLSCDKVGTSLQGAWRFDLDDSVGVFLKEKNISDLTVSTFGAVFFTTAIPTADVCGFGGKNRSWAFNCATGGSITVNTCSGASIQLKPFKYLVQLSGGNIEEYAKENFTQEGGRATQIGYGIPGEAGGKLVTPSQVGNMRILLWLEK